MTPGANGIPFVSLSAIMMYIAKPKRKSLRKCYHNRHLKTAQVVTPEASICQMPKLFVGIMHDWLYTALHRVQRKT